MVYLHDLALGRFIQPDTLVPDPSSSGAYDRYAYVNNNPINYVDPSGHMPKGECGNHGEDCGNNSPADQYRDYVYNVAHDDVERTKNSRTAEAIFYGGTELALTIIAPPVGLLYQVVSDKKITGMDVAFGLIPFGIIGDLGKGIKNLDNLPINEVREIIENSPKINKVLNVAGEARTEGQFIDDALEFIGNDYQELYSGVFRTQVEGGFRQVRFTNGDLLHLVYGPHGHFEYLDEFGNSILNIHIPLLGD